MTKLLDNLKTIPSWLKAVIISMQGLFLIAVIVTMEGYYEDHQQQQAYEQATF